MSQHSGEGNSKVEGLQANYAVWGAAPICICLLSTRLALTCSGWLPPTPACMRDTSPTQSIALAFQLPASESTRHLRMLSLQLVSGGQGQRTELTSDVVDGTRTVLVVDHARFPNCPEATVRGHIDTVGVAYVATDDLMLLNVCQLRGPILDDLRTTVNRKAANPDAGCLIRLSLARWQHQIDSRIVAELVVVFGVADPDLTYSWMELKLTHLINLTC